MVDDVEFAKVNARVALLERQVNFLMQQLKMQYVDPPASQLFPEVAALRRKGDLIGAIQLYRRQTNASLAEAKTYVENIPL
jgi:ribosomal protein L7/L12